MNYLYYLHFQLPHTVEEVISNLGADCTVTHHFDSAFEIESNLSRSKMRHLIRQFYGSEYYYFAFLKNSVYCIPSP